MRHAVLAAFAACIGLGSILAAPASAGDDHDLDRHRTRGSVHSAGRRGLSTWCRAWTRAPLKSRLLKCQNGPFRRTDFSIAHRGAPLQFPEHTKEAYEAGARMGAGIVECDVTFTKDGQLVCRHDECDLHTTTNIVDTPLNASCTVPWSGANSGPRCCASDITLAQFKTLKGKMDASNPAATTAAGYLGGTAACAPISTTAAARLLTLQGEHRAQPATRRQTHARAQGRQPGARQPGVRQPGELRAGDDQRVQARAACNPRDVYAQSFNLADVLVLGHARARIRATSRVSR